MFLDLNNPQHAHVNERLCAEQMIWLSSVRPNGKPHLVAVWFVWDGTAFYMLSMPKQQKVRNLKANPNVMLALDTADNGGDVIILEGVAELLDLEAGRSIFPLYAEKYKDGLGWLNWSMDQYIENLSQLIRITPTKVIGKDPGGDR